MSRKKWIYKLDGSEGVIFCAPLCDYNRVLFDDGRTNSLFESLSLFNELIAARWFRRCNLFLILNKCDVLKECIQNGYCIKYYFNKENKDYYDNKLSYNYINHDWYGKHDEKLSSYNGVDYFRQLRKMKRERKHGNHGKHHNSNNNNDETKLMALPHSDSDRKLNKEKILNQAYNDTVTFIRQQFVNIATHYGKVLNENFFVYIVNATSSDEMKHVFDDIVQAMMSKHNNKKDFWD